jgi:hypothetical protein
LVGVDHQVDVIADHLARDSAASNVILSAGAHLELHVGIALVDHLLAQPP